MAPSSEDFTLCHSGQEPGESPNSDFLFANTCCSPAVAVHPPPPPFSLAHSECFPPNHNNSESAKTYQSLAKLCLQRGQPAGFYGLVQQQLILHSATNPI